MILLSPVSIRSETTIAQERNAMVATVLDKFAKPPSAELLGTHVLDTRPKDGWVRVGFDALPAFANPAGFIQGGILATMLDDTMGPEEKKIVALHAAVGPLERAIGRPPAPTDNPAGL